MPMRAASLFIRALTLAIRFALIFVLAIFFEPADVGLYGLIVATVSYALYPVGFDFYVFSTRDLLGRPKSEWPELLVSQGALFLCLYGLVLPLLFFVFSAELLPWSLIAWVVGLIIVEHLGQEIMRLAIAMGRPVLGTVLLFVRQGIWAVAFVVAMWLEPSYRTIEHLLSFWLVGSAGSVLVGTVIFRGLGWRGQVRRVNWQWLRTGIRVALPMLVATLAIRAIFTSDRYLFEMLNSSDLLGVYTLFIGLAGAILAFMDAGVFAFIYPKMIKAFKAGDLAGFTDLRSNLARQTFLWVFVLVALGSALGPMVLNVLPNELYAAHWPLLIACLVAMGMFVASMVPHYGLYSMSLDKPIIISNILGLGVFAGSGYLISQFSGYWAVPMAICGAAAVMGVSKHVFLISRLSGVSDQSA